jgi:predicted PurR-regulated permease PerM
LTSRILLVLFAGLLFALVLRAAAGAAERRLHVPYKAGVAVCVVLLVTTMGLGFYFALPAMGAQLHEVAKTLPDTVQRVSQTLHLPALGVAGASKPQDLAANIEKLTSHAVTAVATSVEVFGGFVVLFFVACTARRTPKAIPRSCSGSCRARKSAW